ncbi:branched-chain amino acid ABC transporter permease [Acuticoccus sp. M5D2P5]|uniref:branched-chain amino acid ABC transporter permease n=1 Tax=Acuticoccus kalidii TaxID=2910977 RepID=UPI001F28B51D|nr:branched-chain amino acid ABC transporter permease [Acuticoccus kalidii]MCF3936322.1 branched-chain amino acid ABC transporter permease [Acuticoccus kalidii]
MAARFGAALILALVVVAVWFLADSNFVLRVATLVFIYGLAAIGLNILVGDAGQVSLGHAGFLGIGAYAVAIGPASLGLHPLLALVAGVLLAGVLALVIGRPILRLRGFALAVATLGLGILIAMVINNEAWLTGGPDGMRVGRLELFGWRARGTDTWYWIAAAALIFGAIVASSLKASPTGRALRAVHDSEVAAMVAGIDVARYKSAAFVISAVYAAIAGGLLALYDGFVTPDVAGYLTSIEIITMVVLGGMGSVLGAVVGAVILTALPQMLTAFAEYEHMVLGLIMMAVMIGLRAGIVPSLAALFGGVLRRVR